MSYYIFNIEEEAGMLRAILKGINDSQCGWKHDKRNFVPSTLSDAAASLSQQDYFRGNKETWCKI
ncbi:hypothetical protein PsorP6_012504 [Peronosclerospora sorghi]|uniref:Uncharacterized protein n=1 Tax=Peronosclerospora sorghi TaxID=230839 RepID=A0ACC0WHF1_9STRA|nr:hypothetical protein PsorP6_012504 [Peronosclerospora sorghi]